MLHLAQVVDNQPLERWELFDQLRKSQVSLGDQQLLHQQAACPEQNTASRQHQLLGQPPRRHGGWSKESVIAAIRRRHHDGACLSQTNREDRALYEAGKRLFGTWTAAREAAGYAEPPRDFYSADEVRLKIIEMQQFPTRAGLVGFELQGCGMGVCDVDRTPW